MGIPPAWLTVIMAVVAGGVVVPRERMANQHRIGALGIECAVGLVHQIIGWQGFAAGQGQGAVEVRRTWRDRKSTRLNSSHVRISYAVFCLKKKKKKKHLQSPLHISSLHP